MLIRLKRVLSIVNLSKTTTSRCLRIYLQHIFLAALIFPAPALATPTETPWFRITQLSGGWHDAWLMVEHQGSPINPENCTWGWYILNPTTGGAQLFSSMLVSALMSGKEVQLVIDGCTANRGNIIAVRVR